MSERITAESRKASSYPSMSTRTNVLQRKCACGGTPSPNGECAECRRKRLQRSPLYAAPASVPPIVSEVLRSPGQPLDANTRASMEPRFGHDFSRVRVHADERAAESARAVHALAYTVGRNIVFGARQYEPGTTAGRRLLAHELTHVAQQTDAAGDIGRVNALQRQPDNATATEETTAGVTEEPTTGLPRFDLKDPMFGLRYGLEREGKAPMWSLIEGKAPTLTPPVPLPWLLPVRDRDEGSVQPFRWAFGTLTTDEAFRALTYVEEKPDWFTEMLRPRETRESAWDLWIVYENDGSGPVPNFGAGSDQGRTAALYLFATFNKKSTGLSRVGLTAIEMVTPRGTLSAGAPIGPETTYQALPGPYSGVTAIDIGVTVSRTGTSKVDFILAVGVDSREWGKFLQDTIHEKVSNSPLFPWPSGTKPLIEGGVTWNRTINDLTSGEFAGLQYTGRLEIDAKAITGTRRTEGTISAKYVIRTAKVHTPVGAIYVEFSPVGALARAFVRYNDGREGVLPGVEGGVNSSVMVNIGRVGLGLVGEAIMSTDPAAQTGNVAGTHPPALKASPFVGEGYGMPTGHHGTGQLILKFEF